MKTNRISFAVLLILQLFSAKFLFSQENTAVYIDLTKAADDHSIPVEVIAPKINSSTIKYFLPKIVPGTYTINNFGRFVHDLKAYDGSNNELKVNRLDTNTWEIENAENLKKVAYKVEDTYHSKSQPVVFEPTGLGIIKDKVFMLNNYCIAGYFEGYKDMPYTYSVTKPQGFYGTTSLNLTESTPLTDVYNAKNYFELHDNPVMYSVPDTASVMVNNTRIMLSIYSPNNKVNAGNLINATRDLFEAQGKYLGGELPSDKYSILVYLFEGTSLSKSAGALEHFRSTTFCYPELTDKEFIQPFKDVVSHEFFHIVTPLGIHSNEIGNFDFINPVMSKHLWLYEGSTEYYAHHVQVKYGLLTPQEYFDKIQQKIFVSSEYFNDTLPFTVMSKGALDKYKQQYVNVYQKGALISMCLDLYLLKLSGGKYGIQNLKSDLGKRFGPDKAFNDDELFDIITEMTYPEIRNFFANYVEGNKPLPYKEFLNYAGYEFYDRINRKVPAMFGATLQYGAGGYIEVLETGEFGKELHLKAGDRIISVNGAELHPHNFNKVTRDFERNTKAGDMVTVVVQRKSKGSSYSIKTLKAETYLVEKEERYQIEQVKNPTAEQLEIRRAWINQ